MRQPLLLVLLLVLMQNALVASDVTEDLRAQVDQLRKDLNDKEKNTPKAPIAQAELALENRYGPNAIVTNRQGKLTMGGLLQCWFQCPEKDNIGNSTQQLFFPPGNGTPQLRKETNEGNQNSTFRIRRSELHFTYQVDEHISGFVLLDPAREANPGFYPLPTFPKHNTPNGNLQVLQTGEIQSKNVQPRVLQDAYINFSGYVPHHSFTIGQFKPPAGEEAFRNSGQLDFVERAMVTGINNVRDLGAMVSGTWFDDRLKYSFGAFNGPSGTILSDPEITEAGNRTDDNSKKDFAWRIAGRPVWDTKKWYGRLELGYAQTNGVHGGNGQEYDPDFSTNSLDRQRTAVRRNAAWAWYRPEGPVKGWWLRGEWGDGHDRYGSGAITSFLGIGSVDLGQNGPRGGNGFTQRNPAPVTAEGWYFSTGYYMPESIFEPSLKKGGVLDKALANMEFAFRYEVYQNLAMENPANPDRNTLQFKTSVYTSGLNYYVSGRGTKVQFNYMIVRDPTSSNPQLGLREVNNNVFVVNFQVGF